MISAGAAKRDIGHATGYSRVQILNIDIHSWHHITQAQAINILIITKVTYTLYNTILFSIIGLLFFTVAYNIEYSGSLSISILLV